MATERQRESWFTWKIVYLAHSLRLSVDIPRATLFGLQSYSSCHTVPVIALSSAHLLPVEGNRVYLSKLLLWESQNSSPLRCHGRSLEENVDLAAGWSTENSPTRSSEILFNTGIFLLPAHCFCNSSYPLLLVFVLTFGFINNNFHLVVKSHAVVINLRISYFLNALRQVSDLQINLSALS